jgi:hypothetical protein
MTAFDPTVAARVAASGIPMSADYTPQDLAGQLEAAFAEARTEAEARQAAQLAVDSVPTDNIAVLRERAKRHAHEAVDQYWGHFNDMQRMLAEQVITPLLDTISRIAAERDALRDRLHQIALVKVWTNEDGKRFVFADDIAHATFGIEPNGDAS